MRKSRTSPDTRSRCSRWGKWAALSIISDPGLSVDRGPGRRVKGISPVQRYTRLWSEGAVQAGYPLSIQQDASQWRCASSSQLRPAFYQWSHNPANRESRLSNYVQLFLSLPESDVISFISLDLGLLDNTAQCACSQVVARVSRDGHTACLLGVLELPVAASSPY